MRELIIAAHPDDETIGLGGQLASLKDPYFLHITNGAPAGSEAGYAEARRDELHAALAVAGIGCDRALALGAVDQESSLHLADLTREVALILKRLQPDVIYTHPYEGGHPDHDSAAFIAQAAVRISGIRLILKEFTSYHNSATGLRTGAFLPGGETLPYAYVLSDAQAERKRLMINSFHTQRAMLDNFATGIELFRKAPRYDFSKPPHEGTLFYESQPWRNTGTEWRRRACDADAHLSRSGARN